MSVTETEACLGQAMFGHAELGDKRRTERLVSTFERMRRHPGGTLPDKLSSPADLKALYRLCACESATHQALIAAMRTYTLARIALRGGRVLIVHDATELDYTSLHSLAEHLGQIGKGTHRGYICHNLIAIDADTGEVLGLLDQRLHCRDEVPEDETLPEHRDRETRESLLWVKGTEHLPRDARLVDVADQGSSTFEFLEHESRSGRRFVIRNGKIRKVYAGHQPIGPKRYLQEHVQSLPELGRFTMDVQAQKGRQARAQAEFAMRGGPVLVLPPHAKYGHHGNDPLPLCVVHVAEVSPAPKGEEPIEWTLLTNEPVSTLADAYRVAGWYERRWVVELDLRSLKSVMQLDMLRTKTPDMVRKEIWVHLLAYNLVRPIMVRAGQLAGVSPREISFKATLQALASFQPHLAQAAADVEGCSPKCSKPSPKTERATGPTESNREPSSAGPSITHDSKYHVTKRANN